MQCIAEAIANVGAPPRPRYRPAAERRLLVDVACNNPDNGCFDGRARGIKISGRHWTLELDHDHWGHGCAFTVDEAGLRIRLHRVWYPYCGRSCWTGNWCWDTFALKRPQALRLVAALRRDGHWHCSAAPAHLDDWYDNLGTRQ